MASSVIPSNFYFRGSDCVLSNFYEFDFEYNKMKFKSVEHCYQYIKAKTHGYLDLASAIENAETASAAKSLSKTIFPEKFWFHQKFELMTELCEAKFQQCVPFSTGLISTRYSVLHHNVPDPYWGTGTYAETFGDGQNMFGKLLMQLREKHSGLKIAIIGSSYVSRLRTFCGGDFNGVPGDVRFFGKGGMRTDNVPKNIIDRLLKFQPNYVFVQLGENDIGIGKDAQEIGLIRKDGVTSSFYIRDLFRGTGAYILHSK